MTRWNLACKVTWPTSSLEPQVVRGAHYLLGGFRFLLDPSQRGLTATLTLADDGAVFGPVAP